MKVKALNNNVDALADIFERLLEKYTEILRQAHLMIEVIEEGNEEKMRGTLARRIELMKEVDILNESIKPIVQEINATLHFKEFKVSQLLKVVHTPGSQRIAMAFEKLLALLPEIQKADVEIEKLAGDRMKELGEDLKLIRGTRQMRDAYYHAERPPEPEFFDKKR